MVRDTLVSFLNHDHDMKIKAHHIKRKSTLTFEESQDIVTDITSAFELRNVPWYLIFNYDLGFVLGLLDDLIMPCKISA